MVRNEPKLDIATGVAPIVGGNFPLVSARHFLPLVRPSQQYQDE